MWFNVKADLTYDFKSPAETMLQLEAARTPDQAIHSETLAITPKVEIARLDDSATGERRAVFLAKGRHRIVFEATVEVLARDAGVKGAPADLHAVAEVYVGGRWRLVDATRKAPVDGMVRVATGQDAADIAFMTIFGKAQMVSQAFSIRRVKAPANAVASSNIE